MKHGISANPAYQRVELYGAKKRPASVGVLTDRPVQQGIVCIPARKVKRLKVR